MYQFKWCINKELPRWSFYKGEIESNDSAQIEVQKKVIAQTTLQNFSFEMHLMFFCHLWLALRAFFYENKTWWILYDEIKTDTGVHKRTQGFITFSRKNVDFGSSYLDWRDINFVRRRINSRGF